MVGRLAVTGPPVAGPPEQVLELRTVEELGHGFSDPGTARSAAGGRTSIVVIVQTDVGLRVYDTHVTSPRRGLDGREPHVTLTPLSRRGFVPIEWHNVVLADSADYVSQSDPVDVALIVPDRRLRLGGIRAEPGDRFEHSVTIGSVWALSPERAAVCRQAIEAALGAEVELRDLVFAYFYHHSLTTPSSYQQHRMDRLGEDAETDFVGSVTLNLNHLSPPACRARRTHRPRGPARS
jgi:hypothetical protein